MTKKCNRPLMFPVILFGLVAVQAIGCGSSPPLDMVLRGEGHSYEGLGFSMSVPDALRVSLNAEMDDFEIYTFSKVANGEVVFKVYSGNFPNFPSEKSSGGHRSSFRLNGIMVKMIEWESAGMASGELLLRLRKGSPRDFLHIFYRDLDHDCEKTVRGAIGSIKKSDLGNL